MHSHLHGFKSFYFDSISPCRSISEVDINILSINYVFNASVKENNFTIILYAAVKSYFGNSNSNAYCKKIANSESIFNCCQ